MHFRRSYAPFAIVFTLLAACGQLLVRKPASTVCQLGQSSGCNDGQHCENSTSGPIYKSTPEAVPLIQLTLPFDSATEVVCTHSSGSGSHSWANAFFAIDLAYGYDKPAPTVRAAADGKAFVFLGEDGKECPEPAGNAGRSEVSQCGMGWGNRIKILHEGGYYTFYVHLKNTLVKNGDQVKQGQAIGVMGATGLAGHRHLHWSVQKLPGSTIKEWESRIGWDGMSVPFEFRANHSGSETTVDTKTLECAHASIGHAPSSKQPRFKGLQ